MKALILGGTGFIGRRLVSRLLSSGNEVTIATSGKSGNPFGTKAREIHADRFSRGSLVEAFSGGEYYDCTFDTIGYRSLDAKNALDALEGRTGKFVYISSAAVYRGEGGVTGEEAFDPSALENREPGLEKTYYEGKQNSEAYIMGNAGMPYAMARFPIVLGHDDSTMRFQDHVSRLARGEEFTFQKPEGRRNYVWVEDAGKFLSWLGTSSNIGIFNGASPDALTASELLTEMGKALGRKPVISGGQEQSNSSYNYREDRILSVSRAEKCGFAFQETSQWIGMESRMAAEGEGKSPNSARYIGNLFS